MFLLNNPRRPHPRRKRGVGVKGNHGDSKSPYRSRHTVPKLGMSDAHD